MREGNNTILIIPLKPLSVNQMWGLTSRRKGGKKDRYKMRKYQQWEKDASYFIPWGKEEKIKKINITFMLKNASRTDIDSGIKSLLDILVKRQQIKDDRYIEWLIVQKVKNKYDQIIVELIK